jgi:hypothetical protein
MYKRLLPVALLLAADLNHLPAAIYSHRWLMADSDD